MTPINIAVLDDNKTALETIASSVESIFSQHNYAPSVHTFMSIRAIREGAEQIHFDLLLLDINVLDGDGISLAKAFRMHDKLADIIFVSNREDKVFEALQVHPYGFIRKNKFLQDVTTVIDSYIEDREKHKTEKFIIFDAQGSSCRVSLDEIVYIEGSNKVRQVHLSAKEKPYVVSESLEYLETTLQDDGFLRIHKGYLVNCKYIRLILNSELILLNDVHLPISRRKLTTVKEAYFAYMQGHSARLI